MNSRKHLTRKTPLGRGGKSRPVDVTHQHLVEAGARWAVASMGACVVVTEQRGSWRSSGESPDVLAWRADGDSVLVEVKVSRADFLADAGKPWRKRGGVALGRQRWYLVPEGMVQEHELPPGWGLLEYRGEAPASRRVGWKFHARAFPPDEVDSRGETMALIQACRRLGVKSTGGVACRAYTMETKCQTEVLVSGETEGVDCG